MKLAKAILVLVDISGYTQFLQWNRETLLHAEEIITELLEAVIDEAEYPLELNKLEGDAAFLYTTFTDDPEAAARDVLKQVTRFLDAFRARQEKLITNGEGGCGCAACTNIHRLRLKAFLHTGEVVIKQVRQFTELAGEAVIIIHRLLKNSLDHDEYILLTSPFFQLTGDRLAYRATSGAENYPDAVSIQYQVYFPEPGNMYFHQPTAQPMSKPRGMMEIFRLKMSILWRRLTNRMPEGFTNLPQL
jgi:hypothetical protein